ncbi:glutamine synthetase family protein [Pseudooceanicola batsensis HTCC2597]|uniref:Glutamine synthetase family protein n=1 Tax=Pseudooceanicola batsensis (strain ATCC BAA-863 / DSM 15984 / KCTC 12145 / HTCC2597) TaxID=252305 RepID=A3U1U8_PSEBH|nr:glutamine synthetase family protein [Pseudooceanicola batsensis]EAQ01882.1 glutamine synthetase family protein [Pseudooceanicola batsensis HTCC2597]
MSLGHVRTFRVAAADLNGQMRGKRLPRSAFDKLAEGSVRMPLSVQNVDIWGADIKDSPLVFDSGDADGVLLPTDRGPVPMPWLDTPSALVPMEMYDDRGTPFPGDPRHALKSVLERYAMHGWTVRAGIEMEFYLVDDSGAALLPPENPQSGRPLQANAILSLRQLDAFDAFLSAVYEACDDMEIPAQSTISEAGLGQFEIDLDHREALRAADDAWLFKALIKGMARKHGMAGTFMAKPLENEAGSGMHVHFSILDRQGRNIFDDGGPEGTILLHHAVAGCLEGLAPSTLVFAPHGPSYDRFVPGAHAPTGAAWAYENRTAALRIPGGSNAARRIEHRVAGGDNNPYLALAAILGAALIGLEDGLVPPPPISGNAYDMDLPQMHGDWLTAIEAFERDPLIERIFPGQLIRNFALTKRQEMARISEVPPEQHWHTYLETV